MKVKSTMAFFLLAMLLSACQQKNESKEVVFVCTHGAARSPIAAAYFNKMAKEQNINYHAVFRGTEPDKVLTEGTILGLEQDHFAVSDWTPQKVSLEEMEHSYKIVTFDCLLPSSQSTSLSEEQWNGTPSISKDYGAARDIIRDKVAILIQNLPKN